MILSFVFFLCSQIVGEAHIRDASGSIMATYEDTTPVEYPVYGSGRIGLYKPTYGNLYEITDHLGNVRAVIGKPEAKTYVATMEDKNPQQDEFVNYGNTRIPTIEGINHTPVDQSDETPKVTRLNGYYNIKEGPGKSLHVMPGDQVKVEVYAKYLDLRNNGGVNVSALLAFLLSGVGDFTSAYVDGIGYTITDTNTGQSIIFTGANNESDIPQAWLNCLFFDEQKNLIEGKFVAQRVSEAAAITPFTIGAPHEKLSFEITIDKPGYLYINVTHDEQQNFDIYFDDLKITHIYSDIVAGSDYYPFGLAITDRQITREEYRFGYQGQYSEKDDETGYNFFELRNYDPVAARWITTDPYSQYWSPYMGMGNDPVNSADPDGGYSWFGAWWRSGFGLRGEVYQSGIDGNKKVYGFNTSDGVSHFGEDARNHYTDAPVLQARENNFFGDIKGRISNSPTLLKLAGNTLYNKIDEFYISILQVGKERTNLEGFGVSRDEITDAGVSTLNSAIPVNKIASPIIKGVNASRFSQLFKGTFINRLAPTVRGFLNRQLNSQVVKKQAGLVHKGATMAGDKISKDD